MKHITSVKKLFPMKSTFHKKLFLSISGFMTALIMVCTIFFSLYTYKILHRQSQDNLQYLSARTAAELKTMIDNMDELALYVSTNEEIRSAFVQAKNPNFSNPDLSRATVRILTSISITLLIIEFPYIMKRVNLLPSEFLTTNPTQPKSWLPKITLTGTKTFPYFQIRLLYMDFIKIIGVKKKNPVFLCSVKFLELLYLFKAME